MSAFATSPSSSTLSRCSLFYGQKPWRIKTCVPSSANQHVVPRRRRRTTTAIFIWTTDPDDEHQQSQQQSSESDVHADDLQQPPSSSSSFWTSSSSSSIGENDSQSHDKFNGNEEAERDDESNWETWWRSDHHIQSTTPNEPHHHTSENMYHNNGSSFNTNNNNNNNCHDNLGIYGALKELTNGPDDDLDRLRHDVSRGVCTTFRYVVHSVLGTLPADSYDVVVTADRPAVTRLMYSALRTGYATRNAEIRHGLNGSMDDVDVNVDENNIKDTEMDTSGAWGVVAPRTHCGRKNNNTEEQMCVRDYIKRLERENAQLKSQQKQNRNSMGNEEESLVHFVQRLEPVEVAALHENMGLETRRACRECVLCVVGVLHGEEVQTTFSMRRDYMGRIVLWCLHVGYKLRDIEQRMEMKRIFDSMHAITGPWS